jgi:hypothetical protein
VSSGGNFRSHSRLFVGSIVLSTGQWTKQAPNSTRPNQGSCYAPGPNPFNIPAHGRGCHFQHLRDGSATALRRIIPTSSSTANGRIMTQQLLNHANRQYLVPLKQLSGHPYWGFKLAVYSRCGGARCPAYREDTICQLNTEIKITKTSYSQMMPCSLARLMIELMSSSVLEVSHYAGWRLFLLASMRLQYH